MTQGGTPVDWVLVLNTSVGLMALVLGIFAIWLSLHLYSKAKDAEKETAKTLEAIKAQSEALQKLTGRWMDRFTRHAVEPKPADEGLMQLVHVVASLPTTILAHLQVRTADPTTQEPLLREIIDGYVGLYYYTAQANVLGQGLLPKEEDFDPQNPLHVGLQALIDRSAADFAHLANLLQGVDQQRVRASSLNHLLEEAISQWRPYVRYTSQAFEAQRESQ